MECHGTVYASRFRWVRESIEAIAPTVSTAAHIGAAMFASWTKPQRLLARAAWLIACV